MKCYKAKWILTSHEVLEDMAIVVDEGKIIDIIPNSQVNFEEKYVKELGNAVITPGFIDLLTQYQYTDILDAKPQDFKSKIKRFFKMLSLKYTFAGVYIVGGYFASEGATVSEKIRRLLDKETMQNYR